MIKKWFNRSGKDKIPTSPGYPSPPTSHNLSSAHPMTLVLHPAEGGTVVEIVNYDIRTDTRDNRLYVVTADQDLGQEIGKIITYEGLRA